MLYDCIEPLAVPNLIVPPPEGCFRVRPPGENLTITANPWPSLSRQPSANQCNRFPAICSWFEVPKACFHGRLSLRTTLILVNQVKEQPFEDLTQRELEVLKCIAEGNSTKQVAALLGITFKTAACHRYRLMHKLGIHDTASLVRYAIRNDIVKV